MSSEMMLSAGTGVINEVMVVMTMVDALIR